MLRLKGYDIKDHKLVNVGGGGKCGVNCVSLHTTGSQNQATEIRINTNEHIVEHWDEIYRESYTFPFTERVGNGNKTFNNEDDFLNFILHDEENASTMWMTHVDMQAVSSMLNLKISILTTGIVPSKNHNCSRCKPSKPFSSEQDLLKHLETVHGRVETEEEREGRTQRARWSVMRPDNRIKENIPNEKEEDLILIHEDDVHYNIIVHKSHNAFKEKVEHESTKESKKF